MFRTNTNNIKILSPNGFSNFNGIQKVERNLYQHIIFDDDTEIKTSINHPFGKDKILARDVKVGDYLNSKKSDQISNITLVTNIRREPLSKKYLDITLRKYYRNYFLSNKSNISNSEVTTFSDRKTRTLLDYILKNRNSKKYQRLKIN